jgi:putative intracellular protease/amidase
MNGVCIQRQQPLEFVRTADVVIVGSGRKTREIVGDPAIMNELRFEPARQLVTTQCSGALVLAKLGHLCDIPACNDTTTRPWVIEAGVRVADWLHLGPAVS